MVIAEQAAECDLAVADSVVAAAFASEANIFVLCCYRGSKQPVLNRTTAAHLEASLQWPRVVLPHKIL